MLKSVCYIFTNALCFFVKKTVSLMERNFIRWKEIVYMLLMGMLIIVFGIYMIIKHFNWKGERKWENLYLVLRSVFICWAVFGWYTRPLIRLRKLFFCGVGNDTTKNNWSKFLFPIEESQNYILGLFLFIVKKTASLMERIVGKEVFIDCCFRSMFINFNSVHNCHGNWK